jgi:hypothetical protein
MYEISNCTGQAYDDLSVKDAKKMLMFTSDRAFLEYISEVSVALSSALSHLNVPYE